MTAPPEAFLAQAATESLLRAGMHVDGSVAPLVHPCVAVAVRDEPRPVDLPFVDRLVTAMLPVMQERGCRLVRLYGHTGDLVWTLGSYVRRWRLCGMVLVSLHAGDPLPRLLAETGFPCVSVGAGEIGGIPFVEADNRAGGRLATRHLLDRGARRIGLIIGPTGQHAMAERLAGYQEVLRQAGLDEGLALVERGRGTTQGGRAAMLRLLAVPDLDGVFVTSGPMAEGAVQALAEEGLQMPDDIRMVVFDDTPLGQVLGLTVIAQPVEQMGAEVAHAVLDRLFTPEMPESVLVPTQLIVRTSS